MSIEGSWPVEGFIGTERLGEGKRDLDFSLDEKFIDAKGR
jgi:hypothetical protein